MRQTTLQQTRSRKPTSRLAWIALVGVWGCAPDPELVYVDLSSVVTASAPIVEVRPGESAGQDEMTTAIPDMQAQDVYIGSAEERALEALQLFRNAQTRATEAVLQRLKNAYMTEAAVYESSETAALNQEYAAWLDAAMDELHQDFVVHAEQVEPLRYRLTRLVGFPDPDPGSVRVPLETNEKAYKNYEAAKALRGQINDLQAKFKATVDAKLGAIEARRDRRIAEIGAETDVLKADAVRRAQAEADAVSQVALTELERTALDPEARLPAVAGAQSSVNSGSAPKPLEGGATSLRESKADVEEQLGVFLKVHGYRLSKTKGKGRDATKEFLDWRRSYTDGH